MTKEELATENQPSLEEIYQQTLDTIIQGIGLNDVEKENLLLIANPNDPFMPRSSKTKKIETFKSLTFEAGIGPVVSCFLWKLASNLNYFYFTQLADQQKTIGEPLSYKQWELEIAKSKVDDLTKTDHLKNLATDLPKLRTRDQKIRKPVQKPAEE